MTDLTPEQQEDFARASDQLTKVMNNLGEWFRKVFSPLISFMCLIVAAYADVSDRFNLGMFERGTGWRMRMASLIVDPIRWAS
jgi:hypothetical protein